jgi:ADP-ribose pyrophosphatase
MTPAKKILPAVTADELRGRKKGERPDTQLASRELVRGKFIKLDQDTVRFPDGSTGELDIVRHPGASAIVPFLSGPLGDEPQVLMLRQFRYAAGGYLYEIPAGTLDGDESPLECAIRELKEETGCTADHIEPMTTILTTPGFTDEVIHLFMATGLTHGEPNREADEFVDLVTMRLSEALERISKGEITDAKTALALMFAAGFKTGS